jgi:ketosteroid isomerase-like protein
MNAYTAVERYFTAFYSGDATATREAITEDFTLVGPFATAHNADEFFEVAEGLLKIVRGHNVLRYVVEGNDVAALYEITIEGPAGERSLTIGGWFTTVGERVSSGQLLYDTAAFDAVVAPS